MLPFSWDSYPNMISIFFKPYLPVMRLTSNESSIANSTTASKLLFRFTSNVSSYQTKHGHSKKEFELQTVDNDIFTFPCHVQYTYHLRLGHRSWKTVQKETIFAFRLLQVVVNEFNNEIVADKLKVCEWVCEDFIVHKNRTVYPWWPLCKNVSLAVVICNFDFGEDLHLKASHALSDNLFNNPFAMPIVQYQCIFNTEFCYYKNMICFK